MTPGGFPSQEHSGAHILEVVYSPRRLATALRLELPHGPRLNIVSDSSQFVAPEQKKVGLVTHSMTSYDIIMACFNDDLWRACSSHAWQEDLGRRYPP